MVEIQKQQNKHIKKRKEIYKDKYKLRELRKAEEKKTNRTLFPIYLFFIVVQRVLLPYLR